MANGNNLYKYTKTVRSSYSNPGDPLVTLEEMEQRFSNKPYAPNAYVPKTMWSNYEWKYLPADIGTTATTVLQGRLFPTEQEIQAGRGGWKGRANLLATGSAMGLVGEMTGEVGGRLLGKGINKISSLYETGRIIRDPGYKLKTLIAEANRTTDPIKKRELQNAIFNEYHQDTQNFITNQEKRELYKQTLTPEIKKTSPRKNVIDIQKKLQNREVSELFPLESTDKNLLLQFKDLEPPIYYYRNIQDFTKHLKTIGGQDIINSYMKRNNFMSILERNSIPPYKLGPNPTLFDLGTFRYKKLKY